MMYLKMRLSSDQGLYVGYSAAANVIAAQKYLQDREKVLNIVTILCDSGYKYSD